MSVYAVVLQKPDKGAWHTIEEKWSDRHYIWNDYVAFVAPLGIATATHISDLIGFNNKGNKKGMVIEITPSQQGFASAGFVQWLNKARDE